MKKSGMRIKRISPISKSRAVQLAKYAKAKRAWWKLQMLLADDGIPRCQVPDCNNPASRNPSHRYGRIGSLLCEYRLWDRLCSIHYDWPERNPDQARACGLLCPKGQFNENPFTRTQPLANYLSTFENYFGDLIDPEKQTVVIDQGMFYSIQWDTMNRLPLLE